MTQQQKYTHPTPGQLPLITLILLISIASVGSVLPSAALPAIAQHFNISLSQSELVITIFVLGYAISQLPYGALANRFGRKNSLYIGLIIALIGGLISSIFNDFTIVLIGRLIMALGCGAGLTLTFTMIGDVYQSTTARRVTAYATSSFAIMPGVGIFIGSQLTTYINWQSNFIFLTLYTLLVLILAYFLPETKPRTTPKASFKEILYRYRVELGKSNVYRYGLIWGLTISIIYIMAATASIISINEIGLSNTTFGIDYLVIMFGYFIGNLLTAKFDHRLKASIIMLIGTIITLISSFFLVLFPLFSTPNPYAFFVPSIIMFVGLPMIFSTAGALAVQNANDKPTASSLTTFIAMTIGFIASTSVGFIHHALYFKIPLVMLIIGILVLFVVLYEVIRELTKVDS
ncbi:MFS transporter [Thiotrichales bacterium 19S3-7]|nr:MFS transporter [Thiotrichales bacterium 19S3-7]MCF6801943.1 MFS transporter [Thiotrichales bacterium 19S3-11]